MASADMNNELETTAAWPISVFLGVNERAELPEQRLRV